MKKVKLLFLSLFIILSLSTGLKAEYFSDIIVTGTSGIWTDARSYSTLNAAVTAIGTDKRTLLISSPQIITALTIPSNITLKFERDGSITNSGQLTIQTKDIIADDHQIFTGTGDIDFAQGTKVKSSWFSNLYNAVTLTSDDTVTMTITKQETLHTSCALGNNVSLKWDSQLLIGTAAGITFSNIGHIDAGHYQIFSGAGKFTFIDGVTLNLKWFAHLRSSLTHINTTLATLLVAETSTIDYSDSVPVTTNIKIVEGGDLFISPGITLTLIQPNQIDIGSYNFDPFTGTGSVTIEGTTYTPATTLTANILKNTSIGIYEVDVLKVYGNGINRNSTSIKAALTAIGTTIPTTLLIAPGEWTKVGADTIAFTPNITLHMLGTFKTTGAGAFTSGNITGLSEARPEWWGTGATAVQCALSGVVDSGGHIRIDSDYTLTANTTITSKTNLVIEGTGTLTLATGSVTTAKIFDLVGTIDNLTIRDLTLVGEGNTSYAQYGIGAASGQTISNTHFENLKISGMNVGISINANTSGLWTDAWVTNCKLKDIVGTGTGQGYGIHVATGANEAAAQDGRIFLTGNSVENCSRHSIYIGHSKNVVISGGIIKDHRKDVYTGTFASALAISRSENVTVQGVLFKDNYGRDLGVSSVRSEDSDYVAKGIRVSGCIFENYRQVAIGIGGDDPANDYPIDVAIEGNTFRPGTVAAGANENLNAIYLYSGYGIRIKNNIIGETGVTYPNNMVAIYTPGSSATYATYSQDWDISDNQILINGSSGLKGFSLRTYYLQGTSRIKIYNNEIPYLTSSTRYVYEATPTNINMLVRAKSRPHIIGATTAGLAAGTTDGKVKTANNINFIYSTDRKINTKVATDDLWDLTGVSTGAGEYKKVLLCIEDLTLAGVILEGPAAASDAVATLPLVPHHNWVPVGVVTITQNYAGGALGGATFFDFIGHYGQD